MKEMKVEQKVRKKKTFLIIAPVVLIIAISVVAVSLMELKETKEKEQIVQSLENVVDQLTPVGIDITSTEGGIFRGWAGEHYSKEPIDEMIVLFASAKIPGLAMIYYPYQEILIAGTPHMVIEGIKLFNGEKHNLAYSFAKEGKQELFYDGELMDSSEFKLYGGSPLTGMVTGIPESLVSSGLESVEME